MLYFYEYIIVNDLIRYKLLNMFGDTKHYNTKDYTHDEHLLKMLGSSLGFIDVPVNPDFIHTNNWLGLEEDLYWCISTEDKNIKGDYLPASQLLRLSKTENYEIMQFIKDSKLCYIHHKEGYWSCKMEGESESLLKWCPEYNSHKSKEIKSIQDNPNNEYVIINNPIVSTIFSLNPACMVNLVGSYKQCKISEYFKSGFKKISEYVHGLSTCDCTDELINSKNIIIMYEFKQPLALNKETIALYNMLPGAIHEVCLHFFNNFLYYNIDKLNNRQHWIHKKFDKDFIYGCLSTNQTFCKHLLERSMDEFINDLINAPDITKQILIKGLKDIRSLQKKGTTDFGILLTKTISKIKKAIISLRTQMSFYNRYLNLGNNFMITFIYDLSTHGGINICALLKEQCNKIIHDLLHIEYTENQRHYKYSQIEQYLKEFLTDADNLNIYIEYVIKEAFNDYSSNKDIIYGLMEKEHNNITKKKEEIITQLLSEHQEQKEEVGIEEQEQEQTPEAEEKANHKLMYINKFGFDNFKKFQNTIVATTSNLSDLNASEVQPPSSIAFDKEFGVFALSNKSFAKKFAKYHNYLTELFSICFINNFIPKTMYGLMYKYNNVNKTVTRSFTGFNEYLPYYYIYSNIIKKYLYNNNINLREQVIETSMFIFQLFIDNCPLFNDYIKKF